MIALEVAPGVHAVEHASTNVFLVEDDDGITLVDAGYPSTWPRVLRALELVGRSVDDVRGLVLTHAHFDHVGFARQLRARYGVEVWAHAGDVALARHPYRYRPEHPRLLHPLTHPRGLPYLASMVGAGALRVPGVEVDHPLVPGPLDLPGHPVVVHTPGHTGGSCVLHLPQRGVVLTGDALVTLDPYNGRRGPRIVAPCATQDTDEALRSLGALVGLSASTVLPGHGAPWTDGVSDAVDLARTTTG